MIINYWLPLNNASLCIEMAANEPSDALASQKRKRDDDESSTSESTKGAKERFAELEKRGKLRNERILKERAEEIRKRAEAFTNELIRRSGFDVNDYQTDLYYETFDSFIGDDTYEEIVDELVAKHFKPKERTPDKKSPSERYLDSLDTAVATILRSFHDEIYEKLEKLAELTDFEKKDELDTYYEFVGSADFEAMLKSQWEDSLERFKINL
jgi:hypothetical protein